MREKVRESERFFSCFELSSFFDDTLLCSISVKASLPRRKNCCVRRRWPLHVRSSFRTVLRVSKTGPRTRWRARTWVKKVSCTWCWLQRLMYHVEMAQERVRCHLQFRLLSLTPNYDRRSCVHAEKVSYYVCAWSCPNHKTNAKHNVEKAWFLSLPQQDYHWTKLEVSS